MEFDEQYFRSANYTGFKSGPTGKYYWSRRFYAKVVLSERRGGRLLEVGCGLGHLLRQFERYFETFGIDVSEFAVSESAKVARSATVRQMPAEEIDSFGPDFFDVVVGIHVIEHLSDPAAFLQKVNLVLRKGGLLFMVTPNLGAPLRKSKGQAWHGFRDPTHISLKYPQEWFALLQGNGFRVVRSFGDGMWDIPYVKLVPKAVQWPLFGFPGAIQAALGKPFLPVALSESLVCLAVKD